MLKSHNGSLAALLLGIVSGVLPAAIVLALAPQLALAQGADITLGGLSFSPQVFTTTVGSTVTWVHQDGFFVHTITADGGAFGSANLAEGDFFTATFTTTNVYSYHCTFHPGMVGVIAVVDLGQRLYLPALSRANGS